MLIVLDAIEPDAIDVDAGEVDIQVIEQPAFDESAPVSMGGDNRWAVQRVLPFVSASGEQILLVNVHPENRPLPEVWYGDESVSLYPNQHLDICLAPDGSPVQLIGNVQGKPAKVGQFVPNFAPTDHPTLMQEVAPEWQINEMEVFEPSQPAPYRSIQLLRCIKVEMTIAA